MKTFIQPFVSPFTRPLAGTLGDSGDPYRIILLYSDTFTTNRAAGAVHGTASEPGPGLRTVVDSAGTKLDIDGGLLRILGLTTSGADPLCYLGSVTRAAGLAQMTSFIYPVDSARFRIGLSANAAASPAEAAVFVSGNNVFLGSSAGCQIGSIALGTPYVLTLVLRAAGCFWVMSGGTYGADHKLIFAYIAGATATLYSGVGLGSSNSVSHYDFIKTAQLGAPWNGTYGPGAASGAAASVAYTFTHDADFLYYVPVTNNGSAGDSVWHFRKQDATNYLRLTVSNDGSVDLSKVVAGSATSVGTAAAGSVADGARLGIQAIGTTVRIHIATDDIITATVTEFATSTGGALVSAATDAVFGQAELYPVTLSGAALAWINALESALP